MPQPRTYESLSAYERHFADGFGVVIRRRLLAGESLQEIAKTRTTLQKYIDPGVLGGRYYVDPASVSAAPPAADDGEVNDVSEDDEDDDVPAPTPSFPAPTPSKVPAPEKQTAPKAPANVTYLPNVLKDLQSRRMHKAPWNLSWIQQTPTHIAAGKKDPVEAFMVKYAKGSFGSKGGYGFKARPLGRLPAESATLCYEVFFPDTWVWGSRNEGGKLPGFGLANPKDPNACATGNDWQPREGSVRLMWRLHGNGVAYVYPTGLNAVDAMRGQGNAFIAASHHINGGINLWRTTDEASGMFFRKGTWNTVRLYVKLNTPRKGDGVIRLTINGVTKEVRDARLRDAPDVQLNNLHFSSFFGGGAPFAPTRDVHAEFRRFFVCAGEM